MRKILFINLALNAIDGIRAWLVIAICKGKYILIENSLEKGIFLRGDFRVKSY